MDVMMTVLRLIHILCGVFWAGTLMFFAVLLEPSIRECGPEGGKVMTALIRRNYLNLLPAVALLNILAGVEMMRRVSGSFSAEWFRTGTGKTLSLGALLAMTAFTIGVSVMRPAALRIVAIMAGIAQSPASPEKDAQLARVQALRVRAMVALRWVASLLALATIAMAVARYVR